MKAWILLVLSALLQIGWLVSLRATAGFRRPVPLLFYAAFGLASTICLSRAIETIPLAAAYAVWTGLSVAGALAVGWLLGTEPMTALRIACIVAILAGSSGLRASEQPGAVARVPSRAPPSPAGE